MVIVAAPPNAKGPTFALPLSVTMLNAPTVPPVAPSVTVRRFVPEQLKSNVEELALKVKFVTVAWVHGAVAPEQLNVQVPFPIFNVLVVVPVFAKPPDPIVGELLLALRSRTQPVVDAVHADIVRLTILKFVFTVIVHVVPPTQVFASSVTESAEPGTDAPVAPPLVADHIAVLEPSHVHVVAQIAKRAAASAGFDMSENSKAARLKKYLFITAPRSL